MKKQNVRTISLIVCTFTYLLIRNIRHLVGAAVFDALEASNEREDKRRLKEKIEHFKHVHNVTEEQFDELQLVLRLYHPHRAGHQWKFAGAFYFSMTVITTIGYGHSTPKTIAGKIFCMLYALTGIPLNLVMFQSIGERLNVFISFLLRNIKRGAKCRNIEVSQTDLIMVTLNISIIVLTCGAAVFSHHENWSYIDSFYYCFITLTTVGFGDFVALQKNEKLNDDPAYVAFSIAFILFGLTVLSAAMNLLVLRLLTMNTEDELRDELEQARAATKSMTLDGDILTQSQPSAANSASSLNVAKPSRCSIEMDDRSGGPLQVSANRLFRSRPPRLSLAFNQVEDGSQGLRRNFSARNSVSDELPSLGHSNPLVAISATPKTNLVDQAEPNPLPAKPPPPSIQWSPNNSPPTCGSPLNDISSERGLLSGLWHWVMKRRRRLNAHHYRYGNHFYRKHFSSSKNWRLSFQLKQHRQCDHCKVRYTVTRCPTQIDHLLPHCVPATLKPMSPWENDSDAENEDDPTSSHLLSFNRPAGDNSIIPAIVETAGTAAEPLPCPVDLNRRISV